ncbi:sugar efflux transporter [Alicyclobacillus mengziensis]|uniref:Sugar efflux transporter n=1 Tax=Alicyclobacillus mengziensis TaxID=2931921 RepID=A0A9X7W0J1_9BACL|nr:sugar efflux transporter [Alicyclobacillus mengziensis]QSO47093.1 sugar efflux transporter [Alicyclobacillus mengziensis]
MRQSAMNASTSRRFPGFLTLSLAITLIGIGLSITRPYLSLFYSNIIHMSPIRLGVFTFINGAGGIVASTWLGKLSDSRSSKKDIMLFSTVCGGLGYVSFLVIHSYWPLLIVSTLLLGLGSATYPQLFAYAREVARLRYHGDATVAISTLRSFFSLAWVIGPLLGTWVLSLFGYQGIFTSTGMVFAFVFLLVLLRLQRHLKAQTEARTASQFESRTASQPKTQTDATETSAQSDRARTGSTVSLWLTLKRTEVWMSSISFVAVSTAMTMNMMYMPLFVTRTLFASEHVVGWVFSLSAGLEIPVMIGLSAIAARVGKRMLLLAGSIFGTAYYLGMALAGTTWEVLALQILCAVFVSIAVSIGMSYFQDFMPDAPGSATTLYSNTSNLGSMAGSLLGGVVAQALGFRSVFWFSVVLGIISYVFLLQRPSRVILSSSDDPSTTNPLVLQNSSVTLSE